ncbi:hypothetical protein [Winogradskyella sp.]|uniref:hypothetical protein n=1 Tax=Winogradskyella sp. TaxID=1883156 RepID=UPI0026379D52|nr:hypothetical protein [Winogradskyella sp.]
MKNDFWIEDISPKQVFEEFILTENSEASFWDIFTSYEPDYEHSKAELADLSEEWLQKQERIVNEIIQNHFIHIQLNEKEIGLLIDAIEEYLLPEEDQYTEDLNSQYKKIAKSIALDNIYPLKLKQSTVDNLIDKLEDKLESLNESYIVESEKEEMRQSIWLKGVNGEYPKEKVIEILQGLEMMWSTQTEIDESDYEEIEEETEIEVDDFIYPIFPLAFSTFFYGFNGDGGNLSCEEQEEIVNEKFEHYKDEISALLKQKPDDILQPEKLDYGKINTNEELMDIFLESLKMNPFMHEFGGNFAAWKDREKVLFLSVSKEDKELPYEINIGGLTLKKYSEILNKYNNIT